LKPSSPEDEYVYDGEWYMGYKQGKGRLITSQEKYSGTWLKDKYHQYGVLVFTTSVSDKET
jgi:hypothetical protein